LEIIAFATIYVPYGDGSDGGAKGGEAEDKH
jgi:hypothetical protein